MSPRVLTLAVALALLVCPVGPALADEGATPAERAAVLQVGDLSQTEVTLGSFTVKERGGTPTIYLESTGDLRASGTRSLRAVVQRASSELRSWESATFIYATAPAAAASYSRLKSAALRLSRPLVHEHELDEGYLTSIIIGDVPVPLKDKGGMPRFAVDSFVVGRSFGPDAEMMDRYTYVVAYRAGKTVVQVTVLSALPMTTDDLEEIRDATLAVAQRARAIR